MVKNAKTPPDVPELFHANLIATALVYGAGALLLTGLGLFGVHIGSWITTVISALVGLTIETFFAAALARASNPAQSDRSRTDR